MAEPTKYTKYKCRTCEEVYKVVRAEAPPEYDRQVTCLSCGAPLLNREGNFALKYFRVESGARLLGTDVGKGFNRLASWKDEPKSGMLFTGPLIGTAPLPLSAALSCRITFTCHLERAG